MPFENAAMSIRPDGSIPASANTTSLLDSSAALTAITFAPRSATTRRSYLRPFPSFALTMHSPVSKSVRREYSEGFPKRMETFRSHAAMNPSRLL